MEMIIVGLRLRRRPPRPVSAAPRANGDYRLAIKWNHRMDSAGLLLDIGRSGRHDGSRCLCLEWADVIRLPRSCQAYSAYPSRLRDTLSRRMTAKRVVHSITAEAHKP